MYEKEIQEELKKIGKGKFKLMMIVFGIFVLPFFLIEKRQEYLKQKARMECISKYKEEGTDEKNISSICFN